MWMDMWNVFIFPSYSFVNVYRRFIKRAEGYGTEPLRLWINYTNGKRFCNEHIGNELVCGASGGGVDVPGQMFSQCGFNVDRIASRNPVKHVIIIISAHCHLLCVWFAGWQWPPPHWTVRGRARSTKWIFNYGKSVLEGNLLGPFPRKWYNKLFFSRRLLVIQFAIVRYWALLCWNGPPPIKGGSSSWSASAVDLPMVRFMTGIIILSTFAVYTISKADVQFFLTLISLLLLYIL